MTATQGDLRAGGTATPATPAGTWTLGGVAAATAVVVMGPALQLVSHLIEPTSRNTPMRLQWVLDNPAAATLAKSLDLLAVPFLVGSALVYVMLARWRTPRLSYSGGALLVTGLLGLAAVEGFETLAFILVDDGRIATPALADVVDNQMASGPGAVMMVMFLFPAFVGLLLVAAALWRSRSAPRGAVALVVAGFVVDAALVEGFGAPHWIPHVVSLLAGTWIAIAIVNAYRMRDATRTVRG